MKTPDPERPVATASRRELLGLSAAWIAMAAARANGAVGAAPGGAPRSVNQGEVAPARFAYVGSFATNTRGAHGEGLSVYSIEAATGRWARIQLLSKVVNPGYLALNPGRPVLYAVQPVANEVSAFAVDNRTGELTPMNRRPSGGDDPSHVAIDPAGRFLVVANYLAGTVEVLPVNADGSLGAATDVVATKGELGPHRTEQPGPHPHQCPFDPSGRFVVVPDKGFDRLFVFRIDGTKRTLVPADPPFAKTRSGAGPRHIAFSPRLPYAWVINELDSTVATYRFGQTGTLDAIQIVPSLPSTFTGDNTGAAIVVSPSGRFVYVSNRGHDSIGIFRVDESSGTLSPVGWESTKGSTPRFIGLNPAGTRLFAANQRSDSIVEFSVDRTTGALSATGQVIQANTPVCVVFR
jgi:6-phosphogluconolactonase (cycloisomerase 2 family)